eukprot:CAMPEP_0177507646 /NCGR_PEP_ID=MMETSP0369-20130122/40602_1 /TAXON_ID=447022 ORGANISM="Scrippsiella hangoei-like, Strain SHHI-4" /NCGR_SAMPLE_ID=MMETSP0369 /ASSEMBLY_ACC=CAM_ASM_000364 /LENGTH=148 /DNA_ID=CAMNT_0018985699 /DNA_START=257 /DNA_END=703 /DNA_ORIENTATION=+
MGGNRNHADRAHEIGGAVRPRTCLELDRHIFGRATSISMPAHRVDVHCRWWCFRCFECGIVEDRGLNVRRLVVLALHKECRRVLARDWQRKRAQVVLQKLPRINQEDKVRPATLVVRFVHTRILPLVEASRDLPGQVSAGAETQEADA